jgi:hypothetical protein
MSRSRAGISAGNYTLTDTKIGELRTTKEKTGISITSTNSSHTHTLSNCFTGIGEGVHSHNVNVTILESGLHTHIISGGSISGTVDSAGSGTAFDNRPSYYTLIYIIKVTEAGSSA